MSLFAEVCDCGVYEVIVCVYIVAKSYMMEVLCAVYRWILEWKYIWENKTIALKENAIGKSHECVD